MFFFWGLGIRCLFGWSPCCWRNCFELAFLSWMGTEKREPPTKTRFWHQYNDGLLTGKSCPANRMSSSLERGPTRGNQEIIPSSRMWYQSKDVRVLNFDAPSCSHLPCQIHQETLGIFVEPGCERLCGSVQQRLGTPGGHLPAIWWFLWKIPSKVRMVRHPQTNLGRWVAQKKQKNCAESTFWIFLDSLEGL